MGGAKLYYMPFNYGDKDGDSMQDTVFLFPFEKVHPGTRVIIYGAGRVGQSFLQQLIMTHYCEVLCIADRAHDQYPALGVPLIDPSQISNYNYDYIVIAVEGETRLNEMRNTLLSYGIQGTCIVSGSGRSLDKQIISNPTTINSGAQEFAFQKHPVAMAVFLGGGLGDCIIAKKFLLAVINEAKIEIAVDLYGDIYNESYIRAFFMDCSFVCNIFTGRSLYFHKCKQYDIAMRVLTIANIDSLSCDKLQKIDPHFTNKMIKLQAAIKSYGLDQDRLSDAGLHFQRCYYQGKNCYDFFSYDGLFEITDSFVSIPLNNAYNANFNELHLNKPYLILNYGWGNNLHGEYKIPNKVWPIEHYEKLAFLIKRKYPNILLVQTGMSYSPKIKGVDRYIFGIDIETLKFVLKNAILHIDCESGLVHLATQLGTKCIVVFGPTRTETFGYANNINITSPVCGGCRALMDDFSKCLHQSEDRVCMYSILPESVYEKAVDWIQDNGL